ncbi:hypothetical protein BGZ97_013194 [Linnemannia gamsii]|uniref:FAD-binding domain-containing protein n=1 Tax=Linnemannia gamsii TaxID=64522 RepID=A0A9P6UTU6_9FUNG|nr:hypothetical protein BGZ97_013194 [Linnemannia gamsii]
MPYSQKHPNPRVIVVGAGIGGLMMGLLLGKAGITYQIFERASKVKALGALMSINANILPVFEQLGLLKEVENISLRNNGSTMFNSKLKEIGQVGMPNYMELTGYDFLVFSRPELYDILLRQIPEDRISFNKRILSMRRSAGGTRIYCSDNSIYEGDIVIGADGAYSAVRQNMHKMMEADGVIAPDHDINDMAIPVMVQIKDQAEAKEQRFRNSEWGPEANNSLIDDVKDFRITFGGTLGDMIEATPKDRISKVMLEEKLFETWHYRNVVLIGDGAVNAMQDAVVLANCLYDLTDLSPESLSAAFEDYRSQRFKEAKKQVTNSKINARISSGQTFIEKIIRHLVLNFIPTSVRARQFSKAAAYRPQVAYLPMVTERGSVKALPTRPSKRVMYEEMLVRKRRVVVTPYDSTQSACTSSAGDRSASVSVNGEGSCLTI